MKVLLENFPPIFLPHRTTLARCLEAMDRTLPLRAVFLFGSHARGDARPDSDVDLCLVAEGAERQLQAAQQFRRAIWDIRGKPSLTLVPIAPRRLEEKKAAGTFSSARSFPRGCPLPRRTDSNNPADWLWIAESDLSVIRLALAPEIGFSTCRGKLAEVLEKILKAELIRLG